MSVRKFDIPENGSFRFEKIRGPNGAGSRVSLEFSEKFLHELVKISAECMKNNDGDHPLRNRERLMCSALGAAANSITRVHFSELPVKRVIRLARRNHQPLESAKRSAQRLSKPGRVDLWCCYRNVDVFIEMKQKYIALTNTNPALSLLKYWKNVVSQVEDTKDDLASWCNKGATIGILCICAYSENQRIINRKTWNSEYVHLRKGIIGLQPHPSFVAAWNIGSDSWVNDVQKKDGSECKEVIPFIVLAGLIGTVITA